jgi:hypothetical protein
MDEITTDAALAKLKRLHLILLVISVPLSCTGGAVLAAARAVVATRAYANEQIDRSATAAAAKAVAHLEEELQTHVKHYETVGKPAMAVAYREIVATSRAVRVLCKGAQPSIKDECLDVYSTPPSIPGDTAPWRY